MNCFQMQRKKCLADTPICIICREDMVFGQRIKKLQCGHKFHFQCLRTGWLERQQSCPTCRQPIVVRRGFCYT